VEESLEKSEAQVECARLAFLRLNQSKWTIVQIKKLIHWVSLDQNEHDTSIRAWGIDVWVEKNLEKIPEYSHVWV